MKPLRVVLGIGIFVPSVLLAVYFKTTSSTEVIGYTTYTHSFHPIMWMGAIVLAVIGFAILMVGIVQEEPVRGRHGGQCPNCGELTSTRFCQNCGARLQ